MPIETKQKTGILFAWSGGKDSALALHELQESGGEVAALLTTVTEGYERISMHGVRIALLEKQTAALGLPLEKVYITQGATNAEYERRMEELLVRYADQGVRCVAFGDIFLEDLKKYREANLAKVNMKGVFPIWKRDSRELAQRFIELGFKAVVVCVDSSVLDKSFCGRTYDREFLAALPPNVDPCGENGEFHSFVYAGPVFREDVRFEKGDVVLRDNRYYFCDLLPQP